jgi:hypothetical protein
MLQARSVIATRYPHLQPGLCGKLECPRICSRVEHCPAGQRRVRRLMAERARARYTVLANAHQERACAEIHKAGLCPSLCHHVGGCFLPQPGDHPSEAKRKVFRAKAAMTLLTQLRQDARPQGGAQ